MQQSVRKDVGCLPLRAERNTALGIQTTHRPPVEDLLPHWETSAFPHWRNKSTTLGGQNNPGALAKGPGALARDF